MVLIYSIFNYGAAFQLQLQLLVAFSLCV
jgi:hypothetical protein